MGIFINLLVSKSVTKAEWEKAYNETLILVNKFPFAEHRSEVIHGIKTACLVPTKEREFKYGWNEEKTRIGWCADGDMNSLRTAEEYFLGKDLVSDEDYEADAGDALLGAVPAYTSFKWEDDRFAHTYHLWGNKSQGEPYHMYLLAVACLLEYRLGNKVFIYGDITRGQCKKAVEIANKILEDKIDIPDRCYPKKLFHRIKDLNFTEAEKLEIFSALYLGKQDEEFGGIIRECFSKRAQKEYWKKKFECCVMDTLGFSERLHTFLESGFDLELLCDIVDCHDKDGNEIYDKFITRILDAKMYLKEKIAEMHSVLIRRRNIHIVYGHRWLSLCMPGL